MISTFIPFQENRSTWTNAWSKIRTLAPFIWPKRSFLLQLRIIACFALLIGGRLVNLYVPIYSKMIGNEQNEFIFLVPFDCKLINLSFSNS